MVASGGCICGIASGISGMWLNVVLHGVGCIGFIVVCSMLTCVVLDGFGLVSYGLAWFWLEYVLYA